MALKTYVSAGVFDDMVGSSALLGTTVNVTTGGVSSLGFTAPNLTNQANGCWISLSSIPTVSNSGNIVVELISSSTVRASGTINYADVALGFNYVRFTTPYTFATLTAGAYTIRVRNTVATGSLGQLRLHSTNLWFQVTYDTATTLGATDDVWVAGFDNAGHTPKTLTLSGTSNAWGSAAATGISGAGAQQTMGAALTIGKGGTVVFDQSASTTLALKGSVWVGNNGVFDMRASSNKSRVQTLQIESVANGDQGIFTGTTVYGGQILTTGASYDQKTTYTSGLGTAASPLIVGTGWDADVGDEIVVGGGTDYSKNELRYIKTRNSSTSFVLCTTPGGAEVALANTHASGSHIANLTRNSIIKAKDITKGWYLVNAGSTQLCSFNNTRMDYSDCSSGKTLNFNNSNLSTFNGIVIYGNAISGRQCINCSQTSAQTHTGITMWDTRGGNYSAQSGFGLSSGNNQTINSLLHFNGASTNACAMISLNVSSTGNTFNDCHSYGANAGNSAAGYAIGIFSSSANTFNNCTVNAARQNAVFFSTAIGNTFNNCHFGTIATNTIDILSTTGTLNQNYFNTCYFSSATLHTNYLNQLDTSICKFQNMDGNTSKHRWYTKYGSFWSSGSGLTDTTVRTASSLALAGKPENATDGASWVFRIPANPASQVGIFGYAYRNATFSSGTLKVELFLPGTLLTATPDATYTFPTTTGSWLPFNISAYYSSSDTRYAQVRITGVTATAGAYFFIDDLYDAGTANKVAGLDLWDEGQPSQIMVQSDFSVVPSAVWGFSDQTTNANTMGQQLVDVPSAAQNATSVDAILADNFAVLPTNATIASAVDATLLDDFAAIPSAAQNATAVQSTLATELDEILSNTDATQAKIDQMNA